MEFLSIESMIKLNVGEHIVKGYMDLLVKLYSEAILDYDKLKKQEEDNFLYYKF